MSVRNKINPRTWIHIRQYLFSSFNRDNRLTDLPWQNQKLSKMTCCALRNPQRKKMKLMNTSPAGSLDFMAQSWHSPRVSYVLVLLLLAAKDLILWWIDFFTAVFYFIFFFISIHSDPCFNYHRSKSSSMAILAPLWVKK